MSDNDNVVYLNPGEYIQIMDQTIRKPQTRQEYLKVCKRFMDEMMYEELLCSILDDDYYNRSEEEIQGIVRSYYSYPV